MSKPGLCPLVIPLSMSTFLCPLVSRSRPRTSESLFWSTAPPVLTTSCSPTTSSRGDQIRHYISYSIHILYIQLYTSTDHPPCWIRSEHGGWSLGHSMTRSEFTKKIVALNMVTCRQSWSTSVAWQFRRQWSTSRTSSTAASTQASSQSTTSHYCRSISLSTSPGENFDLLW